MVLLVEMRWAVVSDTRIGVYGILIQPRSEKIRLTSSTMDLCDGDGDGDGGVFRE